MATEQFSITKMLYQFNNWDPECKLAKMAKIQDRILRFGRIVFNYNGHEYSIEFGSTDHRRLSLGIDHQLLGSIYLNDGRMEIYTDSLLFKNKMKLFIDRYNQESAMREAHAESMIARQNKTIAIELQRKANLQQAINDIANNIQS